MKAMLISENKKRKTAQIVIKYDVSDCKRSETRHCVAGTGATWRGYILDNHRTVLETAALATKMLASSIDAMNRELGIKAKKAESYTPALFFEWSISTNNEDYYMAHINTERQRAEQCVRHLNDIGDRLRVQVEAHRAAEQEKRRKTA